MLYPTVFVVRAVVVSPLSALVVEKLDQFYRANRI